MDGCARVCIDTENVIRGSSVSEHSSKVYGTRTKKKNGYKTKVGQKSTIHRGGGWEFSMALDKTIF